MGIRKIKKNIKQNVLKFPAEMYTDLIGSIVITSFMLNTEKPSVVEIKKSWKKFKRYADTFCFKDKDNFINEVLTMFDMPSIPEGTSAFVQSKYNCLVAPYINGEIYPLREDGIPARTLREGKIYPIVKEKVKDVMA